MSQLVVVVLGLLHPLALDLFPQFGHGCQLLLLLGLELLLQLFGLLLAEVVLTGSGADQPVDDLFQLVYLVAQFLVLLDEFEAVVLGDVTGPEVALVAGGCLLHLYWLFY